MIEKLPEIRIRTRISQEELEKKVGKIITDKDVTFVATNKCKVLKPNGELLFIYIPKAIPEYNIIQSTLISAVASVALPSRILFTPSVTLPYPIAI